METRLQNALVENEILKEWNKRVGIPSEKISYAQAAAMREPRPQGAVDSKKKIATPKEKYEVVIIRPEKEDSRNNEQIKEEVMKKLEGVRERNLLKVRNIRQTRKQGVLIEVVDHKDVETINACDMKKDGFVVERPKKVNPSIIIYDVEKDYKEEDLKEDLTLSAPLAPLRSHPSFVS